MRVRAGCSDIAPEGQGREGLVAPGSPYKQLDCSWFWSLSIGFGAR